MKKIVLATLITMTAASGAMAKDSPLDDAKHMADLQQKLMCGGLVASAVVNTLAGTIFLPALGAGVGSGIAAGVICSKV